MKILFTGGGTGGHLFPIIAIIRELKNSPVLKDKKIKIYFIGPNGKITQELLRKENVEMKAILAGKIRRYITPKSIIQNIIDLIFKIPIGFIQSFIFVRIISPDIVFSKGGYGAVPVNIVARALKIPLFLHESDMVPGKTTRLFAKTATIIFTSFQETKIDNVIPSKVLCVGNPIRSDLLSGNKEEGKKLFNLSGDKPVIFICGGSQGAKEMNELALTALPDLLKNFEIIHQCGLKNYEEAKVMADIIIKEQQLAKRYHLFDFLTEDEMKQAYKSAHLIISRAGSGAIFEIAATGKPSIIIPLPESSQDHQAKNANAYASTGATIIMEPKNPTPALLFSKIMLIFSQPEKLLAMSKAALGFAKPDAAKTIAEHLTKYLYPDALEK
ncbi:undecaprenyldiphospho-muramoylpentapeptide beta-N-acetylglucosaminyltransferase [Patescibacteria group bacterium]|nr:undecaprenyldiphospho-muramoylpentapeptide beta-N-acetylglucosaminyltransferase [Patescibacteria group bacterium]MBU4162169.1 undecaprenyldiphospho-muramoylpentapeptide beta-N-acetylglucosaminyltransferase [Patescibacteria group bacterium]